MKRKTVSLFLAIWIFLQTLAGPISFVAYAQTPDPTVDPVAEEPLNTPEPSAQPSSTPIVTPTPSSSPTSVPSATSSSSPVSTASATLTPTPTPTMSPEEYDAWKEEKNRLDDEQEAREDIWEANEKDKAWVAAHGGDEKYFTSGQWQTDQDAAAALAAQQAQTDQQTQQQLENDPFETSAPTVDQTLACSSQNGLDTTVTNNNCAAISNNSSSNGTSGQNTVHKNDGSVDVATGNASANGQSENNANTNTTSGQAQGFAKTNSEENLVSEEEPISGFNYTNDGSGLSVDNNNTLLVDNNMEVEGVSGQNTVTDNDGNATLTTGDVELIANMLNILNLNITGDDFLSLIVNIFGQLDGNLDLDDIATALGYADDDQLEILAQSSQDQTGEEVVEISNDNNAVVNNNLNVSGVSGGNEVTGNDGQADVVTGRIEILANVLNFINTNMSGEKWKFIMVNIFGSLNGDVVVPGTEQFLGSEGSTDSNNYNATDDSVTNTNNVQLTNNVNSNAVSGENEQNNNDDENHTLATGGTDVQNQILNYLNFNITGNNWVFLIVNVFGKWMGQIVGFGDNPPMDAPDQGSFAALSVGQGGQSEGSSEETQNQTSVDNTNNAVVNNNINVEGISGQNKVNENDGETSLVTGWVEIDTNLLNIINTNITGRSWMVVFLNVFGDFMGNLFFGQNAADTYNQQSQPSAQGGNAEQSASNSSSSSSNSDSPSQSNESSSESQIAQTVVDAQGNQYRVRGSQVLAVSSTDDEQENPSVYQGESFENHTQEDQGPTGLLGFILNKLGLIRDFLYNLYANVRSIVDPAFAQSRQVIPLS